MQPRSPPATRVRTSRASSRTPRSRFSSSTPWASPTRMAVSTRSSRACWPPCHAMSDCSSAPSCPAGDDAPVLVPFGGAEHEWAAVELEARIASATDNCPLRLAGVEADLAAGRRDASRLLARAALLVQQVTVFLGLARAPRARTRTAPARGDRAGAGRGGRGLPDGWRTRGVGQTRAECWRWPPRRFSSSAAAQSPEASPRTRATPASPGRSGRAREIPRLGRRCCTARTVRLRKWVCDQCEEEYRSPVAAGSNHHYAARRCRPPCCSRPPSSLLAPLEGSPSCAPN